MQAEVGDRRVIAGEDPPGPATENADRGPASEDGICDAFKINCLVDGGERSQHGEDELALHTDSPRRNPEFPGARQQRGRRDLGIDRPGKAESATGRVSRTDNRIALAFKAEGVLRRTLNVVSLALRGNKVQGKITKIVVTAGLCEDIRGGVLEFEVHLRAQAVRIGLHRKMAQRA